MVRGNRFFAAGTVTVAMQQRFRDMGMLIAFIAIKKMLLYDSKKLERLHQLLTRKEQTIAVAESVTAGFLQAAIAQAEEASTFFQGGITAYNLGQKFKHLKVDPIHAGQTNSVSKKVAATMALQVRELFGSDWGIAITGYATPVPESGNRLFAFYAIAQGEKIVRQGKLNGPAGKGPYAVQQYFLTRLLDELLSQLRK
jgi:PncC family amidohydrolase